MADGTTVALTILESKPLTSKPLIKALWPSLNSLNNTFSNAMNKVNKEHSNTRNGSQEFSDYVFVAFQYKLWQECMRRLSNKM